MSICELLEEHLTNLQSRNFKGVIQVSSNQKAGLNDTTSDFSVNILNGALGEHVLLDSVILTNDVPNINRNNFGFVLNGNSYNFPIGQYSTTLELVNMIALSLTTAAGHPISVIYTPDRKILFIGTVGFVDNLELHKSVARMLGFSSTQITIPNATIIQSESMVSDSPIYSKFYNICVYGVFEDRSFTYGGIYQNVLCCVPVKEFGQVIDHREVQTRYLNMKKFVSKVTVKVLDEFGDLVPLGVQSLTINLYYK